MLLRPKSPGNVGSVARAMKNMGFSRLILADPMTYEDPDHFDREARRMAWQASDLLDGRQATASLELALAPFSLVAGTTSRPSPGARVVSPRGLAAEIASHLAADVSASACLLFGQEDIGLTLDDLSRCGVIGVIPSAEAYLSLNLSQAALLFLYELRLALIQGDGANRTGPDPLPTHAMLEGFYTRLQDALDSIGFLQGSSREHMMRELRRILNRSLLTARELSIFEGIVRQILWSASRGRTRA